MRQWSHSSQTPMSHKEGALELGCDWQTMNDIVCRYWAVLLEADRKRL